MTTYERYQKERKELVERYRGILKSEMEGILKDLGMYETDVIELKTGTRGRLVPFSDIWDDPKTKIVFVPYKKNGELSQTHKLTYTYEHEYRRELGKKYVVT